MFSGSVCAGFLTVLAEKCTRPLTLQFLWEMCPSAREILIDPLWR